MIESQRDELTSALSAPLELPCGRIVPNRLVKAAMEELMSTDTLPNENLNTLYEKWSRGKWGMIISGNVQVDPRHLGLPFDVAIPLSTNSDSFRRETLPRFASWSRSMTLPSSDDDKPAPLRIMQLNHPGRQSMRFFTGRSIFSPTLAPSSVTMTAGQGIAGKWIGSFVWGTPKEMDEHDLDMIVEQFRRGAEVAKKSGWDGVQLHASHGYLLAQFLSPRTNLRKDAFGGTAKKRLKLLLRIADAIRKEQPLESGFVLGVKLNASDYIKGGLTEEDALDNVKWIAEHGGFDFIEISGGSYESPRFLSMKSSNREREAFFSTFSARASELLRALDSTSLPSPKPAILLTGGFRTREGMSTALGRPISIDESSSSSPSAAVTDLIGVGRPSSVDPSFARRLLDSTIPLDEARLPEYSTSEKGTTMLRWIMSWMTLFGPSLDVFYHTMLLRHIALDRDGLKKERERDRRGEEGERLRQEDDGEVRRRLMPFWTLASEVYVKPLLPRGIGLASTIVVVVACVGLSLSFLGR